MRWAHPEWALLEPDRFVPLAEETGLIVPMGSWVLKEACGEQAKRWQEKLSLIPPLMLHVNVSGKQLQRANLLPTVEEASEESGPVRRGKGFSYLRMAPTRRARLVAWAGTRKGIAVLIAERYDSTMALGWDFLRGMVVCQLHPIWGGFAPSIISERMRRLCEFP